MRRKVLIILGAVGLLVVGILIGVAFVMVPRMANGAITPTQAAGMHRGPGMMGGGGTGGSGMMGGGNSTPGGLAAVAPDGEKLPVDSTSAAVEGTASQKVGSLNVTLTLSPYPPVGFEPAKFDVLLTDESGQAVSDATVTLDLTMPSMWMPENKPEAKYIENGLYQADGRFTMRGQWRIEVIIQRGDEKQSAFFDVGL